MWVDNGSGQWVWQGIVTETGVPEQPSTPPPSAGSTQPRASGSVPAFSGPNPTFTPDPSQFKSPGTGQNPGTHQAPTVNPFTGVDLVTEQTGAQTANLMVDPVTGRRFDPTSGTWSDAPAPPSMAPVDPSAAASAAAAQGAREAAARGQDPSAGATQAARQATGQPAPEAPGTSTTSGPPELDRARIDSLLGQLGGIRSAVTQLGLSDAEFSAAVAQLQMGLERAQRQALATARSGNRRDRAANERLAITQQAQLASDTNQQAALLRANEEQNQRQFKLDALKAAGELGISEADIDMRAQAIDIESATAYLNNLFANERLNLEIDQREAERVTNFMRDMALIQKDYYALNQQERIAVMNDLTQRYGISEQARLAMAQLDAQPGFWEKAALGLIGGAGQGATMAIGAKVLGTSDVRAKTNIEDTTEAELEELLSTIKSQTWNYKDPAKPGRGRGRYVGSMAQDLQKSELGASMVSKSPDGTLQVDGGRAGAAALSGLAMVYDKLKALEESL